MSFVRIDKVLSKLGYATRSEAISFLRKHTVLQWVYKNGKNNEKSGGAMMQTSAMKRITSTSHKIPLLQGLSQERALLTVDDMTYESRDLCHPMTILVHKDRGLVCSTSRDEVGSNDLQTRRKEGDEEEEKEGKSEDNSSTTTDTTGNRLIYDVLPPNFMHMHPTLSCIGRLDKDTSGLILMTQDGELQNYINSVHVPKTYVAHVKPRFVSQEEFHTKIASVFESGTLVLRNEKRACKPARTTLLDDRSAAGNQNSTVENNSRYGDTSQVAVTIHEGMYHQVRRMFAACGYRVTELQRVQIGDICLYGDGRDSAAGNETTTSTMAATSDNNTRLLLGVNQWRRVSLGEIERLKSFKNRNNKKNNNNDNVPLLS